MLKLFSIFARGLKRTSQSLAGAVGGLFGAGKLDDEAIDTIEEALYGADFGVETTDEIVEEIRQAYKKNKELRGQEAAEIGANVLGRLLAGAERPLELGAHQPEVICLVGVNGAGKTTTAAKLAWRFREELQKETLLCAADTFRAAANEQIKAWAERLDIDLVSSQQGADSAAVVFDGYEAARSREKDILVVDTAGRLHTKSNLMQELAKIRRVLQKHDPEAPHHTWLVVDGNLGTNSVEQARVFHQEFGLTGIIVTKLDGTSRGGAIAGIFRELELPIHFVGLGEQPEDLMPFSAQGYARAVFGLEEE